MSFLVRPYRAEPDERFVIGAWVASNRFAPGYREMARAVYEHEARRWTWVQTDRNQILVAHAAESPDALVGFVAYRIPDWDGLLVNYVYVKKPARRLGIAKMLLEAAKASGTVVYTHLPVVRGLKVPGGWTYNPYLRGA